MKSGKAGMGMHKHGVSGCGRGQTKSFAVKFAMQKAANEDLKRKAAIKKFRKGRLYSSVREVFDDQ